MVGFKSPRSEVRSTQLFHFNSSGNDGVIKERISYMTKQNCKSCIAGALYPHTNDDGSCHGVDRRFALVANNNNFYPFCPIETRADDELSRPPTGCRVLARPYFDWIIDYWQQSKKCSLSPILARVTVLKVRPALFSRN